MNIESFSEKDEAFHDPQWARRVVKVWRPMAVIENMYEMVFECGHDPLVFADQPPQVGAVIFCPDCYKAAQ